MWKSVTALAGALMLTACASLSQLSSEVSTYNLWPAGRPPASYVFERLPSQQANAQQTQVLEDAAARALEQAGFKPAPNRDAADVTVTLGARVSAHERPFYDDPFWWHGGLYGHRFYGSRYSIHPGFAWRWGHPFYDSPTYEREVAVLIRDRRSGQPLYEARAANDGFSPSIDSLLGAMFTAALKDFPYGGPSPRRVVTPIAS